MKNLENVRDFYTQVKAEANFDFDDVAIPFVGHDVFADPPIFHKVCLPFFGEAELTLIAINLSCPSGYLARCKIAEDEDARKVGDKKVAQRYSYKSRVSFFMKPTAVTKAAGFDVETKYGPFAGLVDLTCNQGTHDNLFGHPLQYAQSILGKQGCIWQEKSPSDFCRGNLKEIIKYHRSQFFPAELHEFPFGDQEPVVVFAKDTTKIGGYKRPSTGGAAMKTFEKLFNKIYDKEHGNVNVTGYVQAGNVRYVIPPFGKNHVAFNT